MKSSRIFLRGGGVGEQGRRSRSIDGKFILEVTNSGLESVSLLKDISQLWQRESRSTKSTFYITIFSRIKFMYSDLSNKCICSKKQSSPFIFYVCYYVVSIK